MAVLLPVLGLAAGIGGTGLMAASSIMGGQAAAKEVEGLASVADYNARVQQREAEAAEQKMAYDQRRAVEAGTRQQSSMIAALGASGVSTQAGTPLQLQTTQAAESELDALMIGYERMLSANRARSAAAGEKMQASIYRTRAKNARLAGYIGAGSSVLQGFGGFAAGMGGGASSFRSA
jgi:hypothetical protein